ncbi:uncharacterized protein LOC115004560 isoform X3 [Cottoperca gobio]|uniref:Uncharacterized protein LOC115004560 isoform X3 n=1 Tax=Cottoperca gobio TaxID=56716 RepID=A0A6J2P9P9_COTGO|nr:uncharacterized protein LOC115004560 isoform X3 [Cottoperca gobio]
MGRGEGPTRGRPPMCPPGNDGPPFDMGPPGWGPPPPGCWGPPPPGGWPMPPDEWGPPPSGGWGPPQSGGWGPREHPPRGWGPGPPSTPPGWGHHPDDWLPPLHIDDFRRPYPDDWRPPHPEDWRPPYPDDWRPPPGWGPPGWGPERPPDPWGPEPLPPGPVPPVPPPDPAAYGPVPIPPLPPPGPPQGFPVYPPPGWVAEAVVEEAMPNPPPDQPEWIKALISAPVSDSTPGETKFPSEEPDVNKAAEPAPPKPKPDPTKTARALGLLGKRTFDKPPPGRSTGIISFIGPSFGYVEREDLEKFTFSFAAFFGNPKAMTPGVRVHFTACREKQNSLIATDVKVAPGGTENVDTEIYEAAVSQPVLEPQPGERQYPGQVHVDIRGLRTSLTFDRKDSTVTLLKNDQVLINLLTDIVSEKRRATNIKPKIPSTFSYTDESREQGVIVSLTDSEGVITCDAHGELPFDIKENFSDVEFTAEDVKEEVEFTILALRGGKQAIRIRRVKEPLLLTLSAATAAAVEEASAQMDGGDEDSSSLTGRASIRPEVGGNMLLDPELYEGIVSQPIIEPTGIITFLGPQEGIISNKEHGEIPFDVSENFSEVKFNSSDIHKEVEFTVMQVKSGKRAIRLMRPKRRVEDQILEEQKRREEEEKRKRKEEEERRKREEEERRRREEELEKRRREVEKKKREEVSVALAAAKCKWTPLGFKMRTPDSLLDISKERFQGTVLKAISKYPRKEIKKEPEDRKQEAQVRIKEETMDEEEGKMEMKEDEEEEMRKQLVQAGGAALKVDPNTGRLVMTIEGEQKQLPFGPDDLLSTATMLDGDKVRFNIATHQETRKERATFVEILPDSFEESIEQRRHGIVIEYSHASGLIKCSQNPQLYFHMSEVIEKKRLELNEKVEFSVVPHETAGGGNQAIRIKRFTESVFLHVRKLGVVGGTRGKMTIKLAKASEDTEKEKPETDKLKAVVKNLRTQDSKSGISRKDYGATRRRYGRSRSPSRSRARTRSKSRSPCRNRARSSSRSPPRDQFGRLIKKRRSTSVDRDRKSSRFKRSQSREAKPNRRSKSRSRSKSSSRSRSRDRSKELAIKKRNMISREREESHKRRREVSPPPRRGGVVDDELARKKRELEELNDMIAYKKSLVDIDPGQRTCIDYDHGRISVPLTEYKPVRSILKKRPEGPDYQHRPPQPYDDPYYDRPYSPYQDRRYSERYTDSYGSCSYPDRPYEERPYSGRPRVYGEPSYGVPPSASQRYTDRYDVYDEPYDDRYYDPAYADRPYDDPYCPVKRSQSLEPHDPSPSPSSQSGQLPAASTQPLAATSSSQHPYRPPSPPEPLPRSPSPKLKTPTPRPAPPVVKQPLDRFLDMLNKKVDVVKQPEPVHVTDDLLPHERALQDGRGFSRIVGMAQEQPCSRPALEEKKTQLSPKRSSVERASEDPNKTEPYDKIQSLLRTIGLKLSTREMSKIQIYSPKSSSTERETMSSSREARQTNRTGSFESDHIHSPLPARSSSLEPLSRTKALSEYEGFLDQQELEALKKAQQLQSLTKTLGSTHSPTPPPGPPPAHWSLGVTTQIPLEQSATTLIMGTSAPHAAGQPPQRFGVPAGPSSGPPPWRPAQPPPGPPPGPPPRRPPGQPPFAPPSSHPVFPFIGQPLADPPLISSSPLQPLTTTTESAPSSTPASSSPADDNETTISTTVARCLKVIETVKSLAVQPPAKPVKSVQFSLPTVSPSASSSQTSTDDDIKNKQKEKLDLYNQRVSEKREQQYKDWLNRRKECLEWKDGQPVFPGIPNASEPKNVWICGHSLVYWAESRAKSPEVGMQLGMDPGKVTIGWKGTQGMTWSQLLPQLHQLKVTWPNPDVLIMHLGGNDLSTDSPTDLLASVKKDLTSMRSIFPQCVLVWSNILPRRVWRHSADNHEVDLVRTTVNRRIQNIIAELGGTSLTHDNIRCGANTGLYRADGVHLSPKGIDVFNLNLQDFLEKWEMELT